MLYMKIPTPTLQKLLDFLSKKPYVEVFQLIEDIKSQSVAIPTTTEDKPDVSMD